MGYSLSAIIGRHDDLVEIEQRFTAAKAISLTPEIALIPMTEKLFHQLDSEHPSTSLNNFEYLNSIVEKAMLDIMNNKMFAYIEAEYFGGDGIQMGIVWSEGIRSYQCFSGGDVINTVLKQFGIARERPMDEFDTVRLGRHRTTERWVSESGS